MPLDGAFRNQDVCAQINLEAGTAIDLVTLGNQRTPAWTNKKLDTQIGESGLSGGLASARNNLNFKGPLPLFRLPVNDDDPWP